MNLIPALTESELSCFNDYFCSDCNRVTSNSKLQKVFEEIDQMSGNSKIIHKIIHILFIMNLVDTDDISDFGLIYMKLIGEIGSDKRTAYAISFIYKIDAFFVQKIPMAKFYHAKSHDYIITYLRNFSYILNGPDKEMRSNGKYLNINIGDDIKLEQYFK